MDVSDRHVDVDAWVAGHLSRAQAADVEHHVEGCEECRLEADALREMQMYLGEVPPEALLDGAPDDADLLLGRVLRQARAERGRERLRGRLLGVAAAAVAAVTLAGAGVALGRSTGPAARQIAEPPESTTVTTPPEGVRFVSATDPATGARLVARITPAEGWVRVNAAVTGVAAGERCRLYVVGAAGLREPAASWVVSDKGAVAGTALDGAALVAPADVTALAVESTDGRRFVTATV